MHTPTISTFELRSKRRTRVSSTKNQTYALEVCETRGNALYFRTGDLGDEQWHFFEAYVLPELNIQLVKFDWREGQGYDYDTYIDIVRVNETGERWVVTDLYLDVLVYERRKLEVIDTDEYLEAVAEGKLESPDAEHALTVTHSLVNSLARHGYSLSAYLEHQGLSLPW